ncbi:NADP-dependent alcohol dehydrogenase [Ilyonectria robusta]|uniref:NADP-dependent alcohol dehydrogenase n=1 Tax=Ilyonectria robusta TaxID=1079257 RepID=UPI001E8EF495|nr:NADP-dependent alcohol dehydrogenase [Ilyonectria robusta]KAH8669342.1 NADP-dependent alcohol dehydrogenase [Ilyonectria robusta]
MGIDFTVFKGSATGDIVESKGHRDPAPREVIVKISHCGVCGTDEHYRHADMGLGHEGVGIITEVGSAVHDISDLRVGDRVGMGWFHKFCGYCKACLTGRQDHCSNSTSFGTADHDQGCFGTGVAWDVSTLAKIPKEIASEDAGPLMCGGITVWNPLYNYGLRAGDRVGVVGVGGLGHMAIQFAHKMGMEVVVFSSTDSKKQQALDFGAAEFVTTSGKEKLDDIAKLDALLITTSANPDLSLFLPVMTPGAKVFPLTVSPESLQLSPLSLIISRVVIVGSGVGPAASIQDMLAFAAKSGVRPQIEKFPMTQAGIVEAMQRLRDGKMRYRGVLVAP